MKQRIVGRRSEVEHTNRNYSILLEDGTELPIGTQIKAQGHRGTFVVLYEWKPDNSITCWDEKRHRTRSFLKCNIEIVRPKRRRSKDVPRC